MISLILVIKFIISHKVILLFYLYISLNFKYKFLIKNILNIKIIIKIIYISICQLNNQYC